MQATDTGPARTAANGIERLWDSVTTHTSEFWAWVFLIFALFVVIEAIRTASTNAMTIWRWLYGVVTGPTRLRALEARVATLEGPKLDKTEPTTTVVANFEKPRPPERPHVIIGSVLWVRSMTGGENEPCCVHCYNANGTYTPIEGGTMNRDPSTYYIYCRAPLHGKEQYIGSVPGAAWQRGLAHRL